MTGSQWDDVRLHVVSGKGGTGKTTVAAGLALALASDGGRVLLVEVEGRQGIAQLFDTPPLPYEERKVAVAPGGGDVYALAIDAEAAMLDYLDMFYNLRRAGSALRRMGAIEFATTIAPGLRDVLLTGKACEAVRRREGSSFVYDAVVLDAPPTGRVVHFLNVNSEIAGLAKVGPLRSQADSVMSVIASPQTAVHLVTLLEEMPVQETIDGMADLEAAGLPAGAVVVNQMRTATLHDEDLVAAGAGTLSRAGLAEGIEAAGVLPRGRAVPDDLLDSLVLEAADHAERVALERQERARLDDLHHPLYEVPFLAGGVDLGGLYEIARGLRAQGFTGAGSA